MLNLNKLPKDANRFKWTAKYFEHVNKYLIFLSWLSCFKPSNFLFVHYVPHLFEIRHNTPLLMVPDRLWNTFEKMVEFGLLLCTLVNKICGGVSVKCCCNLWEALTFFSAAVTLDLKWVNVLHTLQLLLLHILVYEKLLCNFEMHFVNIVCPQEIICSNTTGVIMFTNFETKKVKCKWHKF